MPKQTDLENLPSHLIDHDAERIVLLRAMHGGYAEFGSQLEADDFAQEPHRMLFGALRELPDCKYPAHLAARLANAGKLSEVGGLRRFIDFDEGITLFTDVGTWIARLRRLAIDREAYRVAQLIAAQAAEGFSQASEEIQASQARLSALQVRLTTAQSGPRTLAETVTDKFGSLEGLFARKTGQIAFRDFPTLNHYTDGGILPGDFWIVAARPSVGKTTMALQMAVNAAAAGIKTALFSIEMSDESIYKRLFSLCGGLQHQALRQGNLDHFRRSKITDVLLMAEDWAPLEILSAKQCRSLPDITAKAAGGNYGLVVIDYLGLIGSRQKHENRNAEVTHISRNLAMLAKENHLPVIVLSQLSRASDVQDRPPTLADLRDSGSLEQDADLVLLGWKPGNKRERQITNQTEWIIAKQRNGISGVNIPMRLDGEYCKLTEIDKTRGVGDGE